MLELLERQAVDRARDKAELTELQRRVEELEVDAARLTWLDSCSVPEVSQVFGYMGDGNGARYSIDLIRGVPV